MYLEHFGLAEPPFRITPHTDFFFSGAQRGATLEALLYAITHEEGIVKISGEVGSGKTMLCRVLMERLPSHVVTVYLAHPSLSREDILYALAEELGLGLPESARTGSVMRLLQEHLVGLYAEGKRVVVLIDEAHAMPLETLEEIRLLSNLESNRHKLLQLVLFGQPELDATLARPDMRQLKDRITNQFMLAPLGQEDVARYIDFRMRAAGYRGPSVFSAEALRLIAQASAGLTRRINILADKALLAAFAAGKHEVGAAEAKAAIRDAALEPAQAARPFRLPGWLWAVAGALATLLVIGLWQWPSPLPSDGPAATAQPREVQEAPRGHPAAPSVAAAAASVSATPLLDQLLATSQPWFDTLSPERWFVQLYTGLDARRPEDVEAYLRRALQAGLPRDELRVYWGAAGEAGRYGVIYGDFASQREALQALESLPAALRQARPYARKASALQVKHAEPR
ncbi:MAG: AAA family ATPase [Rhodocyclaceae bacterium]|nr:AAA family ATPase [Rhodocyclaceae bacterium]